MNYKNTFFKIDPMVIFKQTSPETMKVIRLDEDYILHIEDRLAYCWKLLAENKSLEHVMTYFKDTCRLSEETASEVMSKFINVLIEQKMGTLARDIE